MHELQMTIRSRGGALVRVLGLIERRGFKPTRMEMESMADGSLELAVDVASQRPVELLTRQLQRLQEVSVTPRTKFEGDR